MVVEWAIAASPIAIPSYQIKREYITDLFWTFLPRATAAGDAEFIKDHRIA